MDTYNTRKVREFLETYFSDDELTALCYDFFRKVHDAFGTAWSKPRKVQQLIGYCNNHSEFDRLMLLLQEERPLAFRLEFSEEQVEIKFLLPFVLLDKLVSQQVTDLTEGYRRALASVLGVPVDNLKIVGIAPSNSAVITVRLSLSDSISAVRLSAEQKQILGLDPESRLTEDSWVEFLSLLEMDSKERQELLGLLRPTPRARVQREPRPIIPTWVERQRSQQPPAIGRKPQYRGGFVSARPRQNALIQAKSRLKEAQTELIEAQRRLVEEKSELDRLVRYNKQLLQRRGRSKKRR